jgi:hypothetical protein
VPDTVSLTLTAPPLDPFSPSHHAMPSLRRAFSSPSVRVSPYPALPSSRSHRAHPHAHRRSSGSDVSDRRVLADIDWWRVADGQRERGGEEEDEGEGEVQEREVVSEENPAPADSADSEAMGIASRDDAIPGLPITDRGESATGVEPERPSTPVASQSPLSEGDEHNIFGFSFQVSEGTTFFRLPSSLKNPLLFFIVLS